MLSLLESDLEVQNYGTDVGAPTTLEKLEGADIFYYKKIHSKS